MRQQKRRSIGYTLAIGMPFLLATAGVAQQTGRVTGRVTDNVSHRAVAGAQVFVAGTNRGTLVDQDGRYALASVPAGVQDIRVTSIGFKEVGQRVSIVPGGVVAVDFTLTPSAVELSAVVVNAVTGQTERKREVGANVAHIDVAAMNKSAITRFTDVLQGRTAGVDIRETGGTLGTNARIRIRGANSLSLSNEPLIYVDGIQFSSANTVVNGSTLPGADLGGATTSRLNDINPDDIESVEVLKGPAASAIYGTAAANGVMLITTRRGHSGAPAWGTYVEMSRIEDKTTYPLNYVSLQINTRGVPVVTDQGVSNISASGNTKAYRTCFNHQSAAGTCRQDTTLVFNTLRDPRTTPFSAGWGRKYGMNVSGGSDRYTYYFSGEGDGAQGVIDYNKVRRINLRGNTIARITDKLDVQFNSGYVSSRSDLNSNDNNIFSPIINGGIGAAFFYPGTGPLGGPNEANYGFGFNQADLREFITKENVDRFTGGVSTNYKPLAWLSGNVNIGLDITDRFNSRTLQPNKLPIATSFTLGQRNSTRVNNYVFTGNGSAQTTFDLRRDLTSTSTLGASYNKVHTETTGGFGSGLVAGLGSLGATTQLFSVSEGFSEIITVGAFAEEKLGWKERLFVAGSIRGDDNSAFGASFGLVAYPSASVSWTVADEPWFPKTNVLSTLRLRSAWGNSGLRPNFRDAETLFAPVAVQTNAATSAGVSLNTTAARFGNVNLKPELTSELEFGFDAGLFKDRIAADFTYYRRTSRDELVARPLAPSFGLTATVFDNLGKVSNNGAELGLNARVFDVPQAALNVRISATTLSNKVLKVGDGVPPIIFNRGHQRHTEGSAAGAFYQKTFTFNDANNDGKLSTSEVTLTSDTAVYLGNPLPKFSRSLTADLTLFKFITLSSLFDWRGGYMQLNDTESFRCTTALSFADRGCPANADPTTPLSEQARWIASRFLGTDAGYVEKANFLKWREFTATVAMPDFITARFGTLRGASVSFAARNLKTWTKYTGIDPEIVEAASTNFNQSEFNTQPPIRYYTFRVTYKF